MVEKNVGGIDRLARAAITVVLTALAVKALVGGKRKAGVVALIASLWVGFSATTGFCTLNRILGIDTTRE